jgi:GLPGLI family protein
MRKLFLACVAILPASLLYAQQKEGRVVYERVMQMQIRIAGNGEEDQISQMLPKTRTDKFELTFANNKSLWMHAEEEIDNNEMSGSGFQIRMAGPGQNDVVFHDLSTAKRTEQREMFDKKFIIEDSVRKLNWKLTGESQTILGHNCQKAIAQRFGKRMQMTMDNGKMERKEVDDTTNMVAWFTTDIPVSAGPEVQGQLPGLILALDMNDGRMVYKAVEISPKVDVASIKAPTKGKKVTTEEFKTETSKMMDEMQKNMQGGGGRRIFVTN